MQAWNASIENSQPPCGVPVDPGVRVMVASWVPVPAGVFVGVLVGTCVWVAPGVLVGPCVCVASAVCVLVASCVFVASGVLVPEPPHGPWLRTNRPCQEL